MTIRELSMESPVGRLRLLAAGGALVGVHFPGRGGGPPAEPPGPEDRPVLERARAQLEEYFAGRREEFDLPLAPRGTPFQRAVWAALLAIPFGETRSYGEIARAVGKPAAPRAVGAANGQNPIAIVVPCHRVIGSDGSLTGYGGGMQRKRWLLAHERSSRPAAAGELFR
jgi:methylated-DNA-[protein]-cysteine S-methyltransferase